MIIINNSKITKKKLKKKTNNLHLICLCLSLSQHRACDKYLVRILDPEVACLQCFALNWI